MLFSDKGAEETWVIFKELLHEAVVKFVPKKTRKTSKKKPLWWTKKVEKGRRSKYRLWKRFTDVNGQKICVYRFTAGFGGLGYHYPTKSFSECPKVFSCIYQKKDKRPSLSEILDGLKGGF